MNTNTNKNTILIVEDEIDLRDALVTAFTYEGFSTLVAGDGEEGLSVAEAEAPNLILLDISMPKMDGLTMLKKLRETAWGKDTKVIVMTVLDDLSKVAEVMDAGGDEYVVKTQVTLAEIVQKVKHKLGVT